MGFNFRVGIKLKISEIHSHATIIHKAYAQRLHAALKASDRDEYSNTTLTVLVFVTISRIKGYMTFLQSSRTAMCSGGDQKVVHYPTPWIRRLLESV